MKQYMFLSWLTGVLFGLVAYLAIEPTDKVNYENLAYKKEEINIIKMGNIQSNGEVMCNLYYRERLAYAIIMANKYKYHRACYAFYRSTYLDEYDQPVLKNDSIVHKCSADSITTAFALDFLEYGASLGSKTCSDVLKKQFDL